MAAAAAALADAQLLLGSVGRHEYGEAEPLATVEQLPQHLQVRRLQGLGLGAQGPMISLLAWNHGLNSNPVSEP